MSERVPPPQERPHGFPAPPLLPLLGLLLGLALDLLLPPLPARWAVAVLGVVGLGSGAWFVANAFTAMRRAGTNIHPNSSQPRLATDGVYAISRNPIYLGFLFVLAGFAFVLGSLGILVMVPVVAVLLYALVIRSEEAYLAHRFGAEYEGYRARVRRWI
jgi:protein-S-isoprenylcysteine O-methyltransferase Ste14